MRVIIEPNYEKMSQWAANHIAKRINEFKMYVNKILETWNKKGELTEGSQLEGYYVDKEEFTKLLNRFNNLQGNGFSNLECLVTNMFGKVVDFKLKNGVIKEEEIREEYEEFSDMLIYSKSELISMYPHHDFSSLNGFENIKKTLDEVIVNTENKEIAFVK